MRWTDVKCPEVTLCGGRTLSVLRRPYVMDGKLTPTNKLDALGEDVCDSFQRHGGKVSVWTIRVIDSDKNSNRQALI